MTASEKSSRAALADPTHAERFRTLLDNLREVVFETDPEGNWTFLNQAWTEITGFGVEETLGTHFLEYVHPDDREATIDMFTTVVSGKAAYCQHETRYVTADGGYRWVDLRASLTYDDDSGVIVGNAGTIIDITERRHAEELLAEQTRILELIAKDAPLPDVLGALAALIASSTGKRVTATVSDGEGDAARRRRLGGGASRGDSRVVAVAGSDGTYDAKAAHSAAGVLETSAADLPSGGNAVGISSAAGRKLGAFVVHDERPLRAAHQQLVERCTHIAAIGIERKLALDEIRRQALHDPLTGLPNRALLNDRLENAMTAARRQRDLVALLLMDLDRFKEINDTLGHEVGDHVLRQVSVRLDEALRDIDTIARLGGDEFAVVLPGLASVEPAEAVSRKLFRKLEEPFQVDGARLNLKASVGAAVFPVHGDSVGALLRHADAAMYRAKRNGVGHALYTPRQDDERLHFLGVVGQLRHAIAANQLVLHYQPKLDLRSGTVEGVEALLRWRHPTRGLVLPDEFIRYAEQAGVIEPLSEWVLGSALSDNKRWRETGLHLSAAVNLSAHLLRDPDLAGKIAGVIAAADPGDARLELEISESAVMANPQALAAISELAAAGVAVAIDDFGTGYSSFGYLKELPVHAIKIDRSFVRDLASDERDASIVRSAIELAHKLSLDVVAEGVESARVCALLAEWGCDYAQGFHIARPMAADAVAAWVRERA
ncbi:MAG: EAL domain-containing protein [Actinomycetota bacterium]|nr:EAL domain-containing protein [Actinomycetota bacterium]